MNKKLFAFAIFLAALNFCVAQTEPNEANTLFKKGSLSTERMGAFLAPGIGVTQMDGDGAALFHLRGGLNFNDAFSFGGFYNVSMNDIIPQSETLSGIYMDYWSAGGFLEYTAFAKRLVHLSFPLSFGMGEVQMDDEEGDVGLGERNFAVIEPKALLEVNLHKHVRFQMGVGYRWISEMTYRNFDQSNLAGLTGHAGLRIGWFR
jgi:hypothetical protein